MMARCAGLSWRLNHIVSGLQGLAILGHPIVSLGHSTPADDLSKIPYESTTYTKKSASLVK
jgi:hypothetical protein